MPTHVRELCAALRIGTVLLASASSPAVWAAPAAAPPPTRPITEPAGPSEPDASEPVPAIEPEPAPEVKPAEPPDAGTTVSPAATAALQQDARGLRDELFKARARVSIV